MEFILSPFIFFIKYLFEFSYQLCSNYGISILLLSFFISLILLPIFILIEKVKKKDDKEKIKMKPHVDEIKRCYKGQERFYYLKTLNRQFNYSPFKALIPVLSLLLQIPFFIAAYQFLEAYKPLEGVGFLFIPDLSLPDGLLGSINILPIIMTVVNLITAFFYTRLGDGSERKQMILVAGIFLVLLFQLPSGLVLYWTMNNVFSFFRLFVTNREVFVFKTDFKENVSNIKSQITKVKGNLILTALLLLASFIVFYALLFKAMLLNQIISTITITIVTWGILVSGYLLYKSYYKNFLKYMGNAYLFIVLLLVYLMPTCLLSSNVGSDLIFYTMSILILAQLFHQTYYIHNCRMRHSVRLVFILNTIFLAVSIVLFIYLMQQAPLLLFGEELDIDLIGKISLLVALMPVLINGRKIIRSHVIIYKPAKVNHSIYFVIVGYMLAMVFIIHPLIVYASYPISFSFSELTLLLDNVKPMLVALAVLSILYLLFYTQTSKVKLTAFMFSLACVFSLNTFIIPIDVGSLQLGKFEKPDGMLLDGIKYLMEAIAFSFISIVAYKLLISKSKLLVNITMVLISILLIQGASAFIKSNGNKKKINSENTVAHIPLAKNKQNVVVFVADMFMGHNLFNLLEKSSELNTQLDGFNYYPNTLSISAITCSSFPAMFAGVDYNILELNKDNEHNMSQKIDDAFSQYNASIHEKDYNLISNGVVYSSLNPNDFDSFIPDWHINWDKYVQNKYTKDFHDMYRDILWQNALFFAVPNPIKPHIYNGGGWMVLKNNSNHSLFKRLAFVKILPKISKVVDSKGSFLLYHCKATHMPWAVLDAENNVVEVEATTNQEWFVKQFVNWIEWMKKEGVYDNTKIIVLSDHAYNMEKNLAAAYGGENEWKGNDKISSEEYWRLNALMLVKDFDARGTLNIDWRLLSNADLPDISLNGKNILNNRIDSGRVIPTFYTEWEGYLNKKKEMKIYHQFNVKENMFRPENWTAIK